MSTEVQIPPSTGTLAATIVDSGGAPMSIIQTEDQWQVDFSLDLAGPIWQFLPGTLRFQVALESIGSSPLEFEQSTTVPLAPPSPTPVTYTASVVFPASSINLGTEDSVSFKVVALLTARGVNPPNAPLPVAGMIDLGVVQVYRYPM